ncbi:MAG: arylesterase [Pseudohongiella sp.]|nr:arylesterase [Pseudohongiella sp.]MDP2126581.1 arylesterase [Pseudohongiella sp.]
MTNKSLQAILRARAVLLSLVMLAVLLAATQTRADQGVILVWGDSLSAAYRMQEEQGWVALLQEKLRTEGKHWRVVNGSVSGETTDGGLARLPAMLSSTKPDIVILELGGNDGLRGLPVRNIRANLTTMIELSQAAGAQVLLAGIQIPPNYGQRYTGPFYAQYSELAEHHGLALIPFLLEGIADNASLMQNDGIHPTAEAQPMIVDVVWPVLAKLIGSDD